MNVEIVCVGTELLLGEVLDTNSFYLAKIVAEYGLNHYYRSVVGDNPKRITAVLATAFERGADVVFVCGGLGPTADDLSKPVAAAYLGLELVRWPAQVDLLTKKYAQVASQAVPESIYRQAEFPLGSQVFPNDNGTAPGCLMEADGKRIIVLPGPPKELELMVERYVRPVLATWQDGTVFSHVFNCYGLGESVMEASLADIDLQNSLVTLAPYASEGTSRIRMSVKASDAAAAQQAFAPIAAQIHDRIGEAIYSSGTTTLIEVVTEQLAGQEFEVIDFSEQAQLFWQLQATLLAQVWTQSLSGSEQQLFEQLQVSDESQLIQRFATHFSLAGVLVFSVVNEQTNQCTYTLRFYNTRGQCQWEEQLQALVPYDQQPQRTMTKLAGLFWQRRFQEQ